MTNKFILKKIFKILFPTGKRSGQFLNGKTCTNRTLRGKAALAKRPLRRLHESRHLTFTRPELVHISHNAPYLPPNILHKHCFQFLLGRLQYPGETEKQRLCKIGGGGGANNVDMGNMEVVYVFELQITLQSVKM